MSSPPTGIMAAVFSEDGEELRAFTMTSAFTFAMDTGHWESLGDVVLPCTGTIYFTYHFPILNSIILHLLFHLVHIYLVLTVVYYMSML